MLKERKIGTNKFDYINVLLIIGIWVFIFIVSGLFKGGFNYFLDDHQILLLQDQVVSFKSIFLQPILALWTPHADRFRPVYIMLLKLFSGVYGLNPHIWYLSSLLIATATTSVFYFFARQNFLSKQAALFFSLLTIFGNQASTYARFGTPETTAMLFTAIAFLCAAWSTQVKTTQSVLDALLIVFASLAALNKEACILMIPAFAAYKIWIVATRNELTFKQAFRRTWLVVLSLSIIFIFCIGYIKLMGVLGPGYGGISKETIAWSSIKGLLKIGIGKTSLLLAAFLNAWFIWDRRGKGQWRNFKVVGYFFVILLIILPQFILYAKSGIDNHYLFPAVIGITFSTIYPLLRLKEKYPVFFKFGLVILVLLISRNFFTTFQYFKGVATTTQEIKLLTDDLSRWASADRHVLVYGNPWFHFERLFGFQVIMDKMIKNRETYLATYGSKNAMIATNIFSKDETCWTFIDAKAVENWFGNKTIRNIAPESLLAFKVIVVFSPDRFNDIFFRTSTNWFNPEVFTRKDYNALNIRVYHSE